MDRKQQAILDLGVAHHVHQRTVEDDVTYGLSGIYLVMITGVRMVCSCNAKHQVVTAGAIRV